MDRALLSLFLVLPLVGCASEALAAELSPSLAQGGSASAGTPRDAEELAIQLTNPVADLLSIPFQLDYDQDIGPGDDGERWQLNVQPVIPIHLNGDWNLISRSILPLISTDDVPPGDDDTGFGDFQQSFFFTPTQPTERGLIWGVGPVFLIPTATDEDLGSDKWGFGPTFVALKQRERLTYGALANHIWSFAGDDDGSAISTTFIQPFLAHTTASAWTYTLNAESTYDWRGEDLALPVNAMVTKLKFFGNLPLSLGAGLRYWLERADGGPEGLGLRFILTFLPQS